MKKYIIFLLLIKSYFTLAQISDTIKIDIDKILYNKIELTHSDSIILSSYEEKFRIKKQLDSMVMNLENERYSMNLKKIIYEKYFTNMDTSLEKQFELLYNNYKTYDLFGLSYKSNRHENSYIISNITTYKVFGSYIMNHDKLKDCSFIVMFLIMIALN
ncbi:MAG: hypothetical protein R2771_13610 [Saprospiraceae bacterium]